jgi:hypothetical protein
MKKFFFIYAITCALLMSTADAMEQPNLITQDSFTKEGEDYMYALLDGWWMAGYCSNVETGLSGIFRSIQRGGLPQLITDKTALEKANIWLTKLSEDPVFKVLPTLQTSNLLNCDGLKGLSGDIFCIIVRGALTKLLIEDCPDFKMLPGDYLQFLSGSAPHNIELLRINAQLDMVQYASAVRASVLLAGYLAQTGAGR